ncbi:hypothetical protein BJV78DRAFT_1174276 [Lactifluus subvellereus]|nr:hypothetical protein BJV78DRAFT_1174276 [Lactifluus subvellereus]
MFFLVLILTLLAASKAAAVPWLLKMNQVYSPKCLTPTQSVANGISTERRSGTEHSIANYYCGKQHASSRDKTNVEQESTYHRGTCI